MTERLDDYHARLMRNLDEGERNELIALCMNCVDARELFERASLDNVTVSMPHPFYIVDGED